MKMIKCMTVLKHALTGITIWSWYLTHCTSSTGTQIEFFLCGYKGMNPYHYCFSGKYFRLYQSQSQYIFRRSTPQLSGLPDYISKIIYVAKMTGNVFPQSAINRLVATQ